MVDLDGSLRGFLAEVAEPSSTVTGGGVNAITTAAAAGLVSMVAGLSSTLPDSADLVAATTRLREQAAALANEDAAAYGPVLRAGRRPVDDPERAPAVRTALAGAAGPPARLAGIAAEVAAMAADLAKRGKASLRGDAVTAAALAAGAARASAALTDINLHAAGLPGDQDAEAAATAAEQHAATALPT